MSFENCKIVSVDTEPEDYFKQECPRGQLPYQMSSSSIRRFLQCPAKWVTDTVEDDTRSTRFGSGVDCLFLTPNQWKHRYIVRPETYPAGKKHKKVQSGDISVGDPVPWNSRAGYCEEWLELNRRNEKGQDREILTPKFFKAIEAAVIRMKGDKVINDYLTDSDKQMWVAGFWKDGPSGLSIPVKCLIDLVPQPGSIYDDSIGDVKTSKDAELIPYQRYSWKQGYHIQAGWNISMFQAATGDTNRTKFAHLVVENSAPYQIGRRMYPMDIINHARQSITRGMARYCACLKEAKWPGYDESDESSEGWTEVKMEPWMETEDMFSPKYDFPDPESIEEATDPAWMRDGGDGEEQKGETDEVGNDH